MILILLATILILVIALFQASQGFYAALIMAVVSLVSAVVAFNYYEPLAGLFVSRQPTTAHAIALATIFVVLVLGLRLAADALLRRNVVLGVWANRIGGGVLGVLVGMILVGVLAVVTQMLPWGPSILGYAPFDASLARSSRLAPFVPDDFVLGTMKMLSAGRLGGASTRQFGRVHDDLLLELFCARNTAEANGQIDAKPDTLSVGSAYVSEGGAWGRDVPTDPRLGEEITKVVVVRATVDRGAVDKDGWWRLPGTHFRLVCKSGKEGDPYPLSYYPVGYMARSEGVTVCVPAPSSPEGRLQAARLIVQQQSGRPKTMSVDWAYRIPLDHTPVAMVFRRVSRAPVSRVIVRPPDLTGGLELTTEPAPAVP